MMHLTQSQKVVVLSRLFLIISYPSFLDILTGMFACDDLCRMSRMTNPMRSPDCWFMCSLTICRPDRKRESWTQRRLNCDNIKRYQSVVHTFGDYQNTYRLVQPLKQWMVQQTEQ